MKKFIPFIFSALVLSATLIALWWFQSSLVRPFISHDDDARFYQMSFIDQQLKGHLNNKQSSLATNKTAISDTGAVQLFHFWNPDCICNRISQRHFDKLLGRFDAQQLSVTVIAHKNASTAQLTQLQQLNPRIRIIQPQGLSIPSSPALAIYDRKQKLSYFGPYGFGAFCTMQDDALLPSIIQKNIDNKNTDFANVIGDGCFCPW